MVIMCFFIFSRGVVWYHIVFTRDYCPIYFKGRGFCCLYEKIRWIFFLSYCVYSWPTQPFVLVLTTREVTIWKSLEHPGICWASWLMYHSKLKYLGHMPFWSEYKSQGRNCFWNSMIFNFFSHCFHGLFCIFQWTVTVTITQVLEQLEWLT